MATSQAHTFIDEQEPTLTPCYTVLYVSANRRVAQLMKTGARPDRRSAIHA